MVATVGKFLFSMQRTLQNPCAYIDIVMLMSCRNDLEKNDDLCMKLKGDSNRVEDELNVEDKYFQELEANLSQDILRKDH